MSLKTVLTTIIAGSHYLVHPQVLGTIQETINPDVIIPVTVLEPEQLYNQLEGTLRLFAFYDDVFVPEFGNILIEKPGGNSGIAAASVPRGKSVMRLRNDTVHASKRAVRDLPAGPYILHGANVHQAWKIYNDTLDAFAYGVFPEDVDEMDAFQVLQTPANAESNYTSVPVPSRLYNTVPPEQAPLKGYRFTVPDSMSLKGVPTTLSSTVWNQLHDSPVESTAAFVKRLVALGAVVVGKTKSSQFGSGREWADVVAPKNPREDGRQDPAGGATGAAAALAGYEWLKASIGLDAIGQLLEPAASQGLFALRTSTGDLSLDDTEISSMSFDRIGLLGTDLSELFHDAVAIVHKSLSSPNIVFPKRVISVVEPEVLSSAHKIKNEEFLAAIEKFLGTKARRISLDIAWQLKPPAEAKGESLQRYLGDAPFLSFCYDLYHQYDKFRNEYHTKFGQDPATEATVSYRWNLGKNVTMAEYASYQSRFAVFRTWFSDVIMPIDDKGDTVLVMPYASHAPQYHAPPPSMIHGLTSHFLASILQTPHILAPFAQASYQSPVSHQTEYHAVYGTVIGPRGSDTVLVKLVESAFRQAQWRTTVDKGRFAFPPAQNARNVNDAPARKEKPASIEEAKHQMGSLDI